MRVNWREEEIRLLLTYYKRMRSGDMHKAHPLVLEASKSIRNLEINNEYSAQSDKFRNPNGIALKLANFLYLDPNYEGKGMKGCSVLDRKVFKEENMERNLKLVVQSFLELLPELGEKGAGMGKNNAFNGLAHKLNVSYAGSNIKKPEDCFENTSPIISFGLGRFTHVPWIVFTNHSQELMNGIYPVLLFYTEQKKIVLSYGISESNTPQVSWEKDYVEELSTVSVLIPETDKYHSSYVYKVYEYQNTVNEVEVDQIVNDLEKVIENFHLKFISVTSKEKKIKVMTSILNAKNVNQKYPFAFENWFSSNSGGVRKPMDENSGRPMGSEIIEGTIHNLIREMVDDYIKSPKKTICILVGGPGNGKTDLMEYAAEYFFKSINYDVKVGRGELTDLFSINNRKASFSSGKYNLLLTQDASQRDDKSADFLESLTNDFIDLENSDNALALICMNRGILESLSNGSKDLGSPLNKYEKTIEAIYKYNSIEASIKDYKIWGDDSFDFLLYTWSMDYDTLFVNNEINNSSQNNLIKEIIDKSQCLQNFAVTSELNPINHVKHFISNDSITENLSLTLRSYEVLNGKRFTYRELFSLIAYLFHFSSNQNQRINQIISDYNKANSEDHIEQFGLLFELYQLTPNYRFFNNFLYAKEDLVTNCCKPYSGDEIKTFFKFLNVNSKMKFASIPKFIESNDSSFFDPIYYEDNNFALITDDGVPVKIKELIDKVIYNEKCEIDKFKNTIPLIDRKLILTLEKIKEEYCLNEDYDNFNPTQLNGLETFKTYLNTLIISFIKRGVFFPKHFIRDREFIDEFMSLSTPGNSQNFRSSFEKSILNNFHNVENSLSTAIGQTASQIENNVSSKSRIYKLKGVKKSTNVKPTSDQIVLKYDSDKDGQNNEEYIVLTYKIFRSIKLNEKDVFDACLDKNYQLWKELKKIELTDRDELKNDPQIEIENLGEIKISKNPLRFELIKH